MQRVRCQTSPFERLLTRNSATSRAPWKRLWSTRKCRVHEQSPRTNSAESDNSDAGDDDDDRDEVGYNESGEEGQSDVPFCEECDDSVDDDANTDEEEDGSPRVTKI